ncbi:unnamed protein product [Durusdinium trenchii]|uniref:PH domain-containing protein n=1 Tax=Durusdinium trenchii TaxID=1381693 RepID=A0ABP0PXJ5_9DINO
MYLVPQKSTKDPRITQKGRFSAWLIKARSDGANAKWFQSVGRRYFTLDFDKRLFYYTHTESRQAQASTPIKFADILGAHLGHNFDPDPDCGQHGFSRPFRRHLPGTFPFTVRTKGKRLRLEAEEEPDAFQWISLLNAAHRIGAEVDLLQSNSWLPSTPAKEEKVPSAVSTPSRDVSTVVSESSTPSIDSRSLDLERAIAGTETSEKHEAEEMDETIHCATESTGIEASGMDCTLPSCRLKPSDFGFEEDEVFSEDGATTAAFVPGSDESDASDSGCEDTGFVGGYSATEGMVGSTRAAADLQLLRPPGGPKLGREAQRISFDLRLLHREVARSCRLPARSTSVLE